MRERRERQGREEESFEIFEGRMDTIQKGKRIDRRDEVKRQPLFSSIFPFASLPCQDSRFKILLPLTSAAQDWRLELDCAACAGGFQGKGRSHLTCHGSFPHAFQLHFTP